MRKYRTKRFLLPIILMVIAVLTLTLPGVKSFAYTLIDEQEIFSRGASIVEGRIIDFVDYPFVKDERVLGMWKSVGMVEQIADFEPEKSNGAVRIDLISLKFYKNAEVGMQMNREGSEVTTFLPWTKGIIVNCGDRTASVYTLSEQNGENYMFLEWKSGDYIYAHRKPLYIVLKKVKGSKDAELKERNYERVAFGPETTIVDDRLVDRIDYPFVEDRRVTGVWKFVDYVKNKEDFSIGNTAYKSFPFLLSMKFYDYGKVGLQCLRGDREDVFYQPWTNGLVLHEGDKTASRYEVVDMDGDTYLFLEWKSGDYILRHLKPDYYVLKKVK